jgi:hypothetical protein
MSNNSPKDKEELVLNPVTGQLEVVKSFNPDRIVTAQRNSAGHVFHTWDPVYGIFVEDGPRIVTDEDGNVVTT